MKALILAGGFGTRLRPLTCTRPKHLLPLASSTLIGFLLDQLHAAKISKVIIATGPDSEPLQKVLGNGANHNVNLTYSIEPHPLGTAGAIKYAESFLKNESEFLVLNGDIVSDISFQKLLDYHHQQQAIATLALYPVEDPSPFGVVDLSPAGRINKFIEKPLRSESPSNLINAGCYVLDYTILDQIPPTTKVSLEYEVFPPLCQSNKVYGLAHHGIWIDTGTPASFLEAHHALRSTMHKTPQIGPDSQIASPRNISSDVTIGNQVIIGANTKITNSVIFDEVIIGEGVTIDQSIIGHGAVIGQGLLLENYVIVGDGAVLDAGAKIPPGSLICPQCHVKEGMRPSPCLLKDYPSFPVD